MARPRRPLYVMAKPPPEVAARIAALPRNERRDQARRDAEFEARLAAIGPPEDEEREDVA